MNGAVVAEASEILTLNGAASAAPTYPMFRVPLQSGQPVQLQSSLPAFSPRFATRLRIGFPHFGHVGASPAIAWAASRAASPLRCAPESLFLFSPSGSAIMQAASSEGQKTVRRMDSVTFFPCACILTIAATTANRGILKKVSTLGGMIIMNPVQFITENYNDQN